MIYGRPFFDLQFAFAEKVSALSGLPLVRALLDYTNFYARFCLARDFDVEHPVWQAYLAGLKGADDGRAWTYRFYLTRPHDVEPPGVATVFGCFSYARLDAGRIRLHFRNVETDGHSPLAGERRGERMAELRALFAHMRGTVGGPVRVIGESWLYNLEAYVVSFPPPTSRPRASPLSGFGTCRSGDSSWIDTERSSGIWRITFWSAFAACRAWRA